MLPPCHCLCQFKSYPQGLGQRRRLDLQLYQRSCDLFLGVPFNIASYALFLKILAHYTGHDVGIFTHTYGDLHIYENHFGAVREQLGRESRRLPRVDIAMIPTPLFEPDAKAQVQHILKQIEELEFSDIILSGYDPHPAIKATVAVGEVNTKKV